MSEKGAVQEATEAPKAKRAETVVETVIMLNGSIVEFPGKRKLIKSSSVDKAGNVVVTLNFRNGETRIFTVPQSLLLKFAAHGAEQKLGDEMAGVEDLDDAVLTIDDLMDRLNKGDWSIKREGGAGSKGTSILLKALVELSGKSVDVIKTFLSSKTQADKLALRNSPELKPIVERLEAEKAANAKGVNKVDTAALLDQLGELA